MDVKEQLQAYTMQLVALGQATLARYRRGEALPDELAAPAAALLALESELSAAAPVAAAPGETSAPAETGPLPEPDAPDEWPSAAAGPPPDEPPADAPDVAVMSPIEAANWLSALDDEVPSGLLILTAAEATADETLVMDVDEGPGGSPAMVGAAGALPPLVIDPVHDLGPEDDENPIAPVAEAPPAAPAELSFCTNCGAPLRLGRRFCHVCGASVAEMVADLFPTTSRLDEESPLPSPATPREEWPTFVSDAPRYQAGAGPLPLPAMARFCNNCGLGLDAGATVCPDCGSRDIG